MAAACLWSNGQTAERVFQLQGTNVTLADVSTDLEVRYQAWRYNRAQSVWNVDVVLFNHATNHLQAPVVLSLESFAGTTGPISPTGTNLDGIAKAYFDMSQAAGPGGLAPNAETAPYTISLGVINTGIIPKLSAKPFSRVSSKTPAIARVRSLNESGLPLPLVEVVDVSTSRPRTNRTDSASGIATLSGEAGVHRWQFSKAEYLPVWREGVLRELEVAVLPNPRLTRRSTNAIIVPAVTGGSIADPTDALRIHFDPNPAISGARAVMTLLSAQTLPASLPLGWSPLQAFWLELENGSSESTASVRTWGPIEKGENLAVARWDAAKWQWVVASFASGKGSNIADAVLPGAGAYVLAVPDSKPAAPPPAVIAQGLAPAGGLLLAATNLTAFGRVEPALASASRDPRAVTGTGFVTITNSSGPLPSGLVLHADIQEAYELQDGSSRNSPLYESFIVAYQRPGNPNEGTLAAAFPLRPLLLFGPEELSEATIHVDVSLPGLFPGGVVDSLGGQLGDDVVRILAARGDFEEPQAATFRLLDPSSLSKIAPGLSNIQAAFQLDIGSVSEGHDLRPEFRAVSGSYSNYVLGRVVSEEGLYGLEPVGRYIKGTNGILTSIEPKSQPRLSGIMRGGQYVLVGVSSPHGIIYGTARNQRGEAAGGLIVRIPGKPWIAISESNGGYRLVAPQGELELIATDVAAGFSSSTIAFLANWQTGMVQDVSAAPAGPRVASVVPLPGARAVARVTPIVVTFDKPINPGAFASSGLRLAGTNGQAVAGSLTLNLRSTIATFLPSTQLAANAPYEILLSTNITDFEGRRLEGTNRFIFTTASDDLNRGAAQLTSYEPTNGLARIVGSAGIADSESPVILVNDTTGRTATVLSKPDGSFDNFIEADVDDFLSAVMVNKNRTRNTVSVSRQIFRDGSVGLFNGGGILEAQSDGGPVQVMVEPGSIENKTKFKLEPVSMLELLAFVRNTPPEGGRLIGGVRVSTSGDALKKPVDFSLPISPGALGLPANMKPEEATYAVVAPTQLGGEIAYQIVDRMQYENGSLVTHSPPFEGYLGGQDLLAFMLIPYLGATISGNVYAADRINPNTLNNQTTPASAGSSTNQTQEKPLPGALVTLDPNGTLGDTRPGRLRAGAFYAKANQAGFYAFLVPYNMFDPSNAVAMLHATHPRYPGQAVRRVLQLPTGLIGFLTAGQISPVNLIFILPDRIAAADHLPPTLSLSHLPLFPPANSNFFATVRTLAVDNANALSELTFDFDSALSLTPRGIVTGSDVTISNLTEEVVGTFGKRRVFQVSCARPAMVQFRSKATDAAGNHAELLYSITFGGVEPTGTNAIEAPDPYDKRGPFVVASSPFPSSASFRPGDPILLRFNEAIDRSVLADPSAISISPAPVPTKPNIEMHDNQRELKIWYPTLLADTEYTLTLSSVLKDLAGNALDQDPSTSGNDSYSLTFRTSPSAGSGVPGLANGGGAVMKGIYSYHLERQGSLDGALKVCDLSQPSNVLQVAELDLPGFPRDLALIPGYSFKLRANEQALTNDLLAVVGGKVTGGEAGGQYLWIVDITNPLAPKRLASTMLTLASDAVIPRITWNPPFLSYLETAPGSYIISLLNLQTFLIGSALSRDELPGLPPLGSPGADNNGDGDYVDAGEELPLPARFSERNIFGRVDAAEATDTEQPIIDYAVEEAGRFIAAVLGSGRLRDTNGFLMNTNAAPCYRTLRSGELRLDREVASFSFTNATPTRLSILLGQPLARGAFTNIYDLALVSLRLAEGESNRVAILDITDRTAPSLLSELVITNEGFGGIYSFTRREDGLLVLAAGKDLLLLDPLKLGFSMPTNGAPHPAIVGAIPNLGSGARTYFASIAGLNGASLGGKNSIVQTPPLLRFISFPQSAAFRAADLTNFSEMQLRERLGKFMEPESLRVSRYRTNDLAGSDLEPPSPQTHFHVLVHAPGSAGPHIDLALESLNWAGYPLRKKGYLFPPVHAMSTNTLGRIGQTAVDCEAKPDVCHAWRLSTNKTSEFYNVYLSNPIALVYEEMSTNEFMIIKTNLDRSILWAGCYLRASLDPSMRTNIVVGPFASIADEDEKVVLPGTSAILPSLPGDYIMGPNPGPIYGAVSLYSALGQVGAHNSEVMVSTVDLALPGRKLPLEFRRAAFGQALFEGPFGRGWDFNFNQRIVELREDLIPRGVMVPQVDRGSAEASETGESKDIFFINGAGRTITYKYAGTQAPSDFASDPLVKDLKWDSTNAVARYYNTPPGAFNMLVKFRDGRYARLEPDGMQYWYNVAGKLERIYDRYETNRIDLVYNRRGELTQIRDDVDRPVEIGYWRAENDPLVRSGIDTATNQVGAIGKICRLKDYSGRDVLFFYTDKGLLERREGPNIAVTGVAGTFTGRQVTRYLYRDGCDPGASVRSVIGQAVADPSGTPFNVVTQSGNKGRDTVDKIQMANSPVQVQLGQTNTAKKLFADRGGENKVTSADSATTTYKFDAFGRPTNIIFGPTGPGAWTNTIEYYTNGLAKKRTFGEGNAIEYVYDVGNTNLRSRKNLLKITKIAGPRGGGDLAASSVYDEKYNLPTSKTDFNQNTASITLTSDKRDTDSITLGSDTENYYYNDFGQLKEFHSPDGIVTKHVYDDATGFLKEKHLGSFKVEFTYSGNQGKRGIPSSMKSPGGTSTEFEYDERNLIARQTRGGQEILYGYNEAGDVVKVISKPQEGKQMIEERQYNQVGFMTTNTLKSVEVDAQAHDLVTVFEPDSMNRIKKVTFPGGDVHSRQYDHMGRLTNYVIGVGSTLEYTQQYAYDRNGNKTSITIAGGTESYQFDGHDRPIKIQTPMGMVTEMSYDGNGNSLTNKIQGPDGSLMDETDYAYDAHNRVKTMKRKRDSGADPAVSYVYDGSGRSVKMTDALGAESKTTYDSSGRLVMESFPGRTVNHTYDANGNEQSITSTENGSSFSQSFQYDDLDQLTQIKDNQGQPTGYTRGLDGRLFAVEDREGHVHTNDYTLLGERSVSASDNGVSSFHEYNDRRLSSQFKEARGHVYRYNYDAQGRLLKTEFPNGTSSTFSNFNGQNEAQHVDLPGGVSMDMTFDLEGALHTRSVTGPAGSRSETYAYDGMKRPIQISDPSGFQKWSYDKLGFVKRFDFQYLSANFLFNIQQEADAGGFRTNVAYPSGVSVGTIRDNTGRPKTIAPTSGDPVLAATTYLTDSLVSQRTLGNGVVYLDNAFDSLKRPLARTYSNGNSNVLLDVRYAYDKSGAQLARQFRHRAGRTDFFKYDGGYRLTSAFMGTRPSIRGEIGQRNFPGFIPDSRVPGSWKAGLYSRSFGYDQTDVLQSTAVTNPDQLEMPPFASNFGVPDSLLQVPVINGESRSVDSVGNAGRVLLWVRPPGAAQPKPVWGMLDYNELGQLTRIRREDSVVIENEYAPSGLRIRRKVRGDPSLCVPSDQLYIYDGGNLIEIRDASQPSDVLARYYYGDNGDELYAGDLKVTPAGALVRHYFLSDVLRSVMVVANERGEPAERIQYDVWGEPLLETRDSTAPRISAVDWDGSAFLVEFAERVLPSFRSPVPATDFITDLQDPSTLVIVKTNGIAIPVTITYEESLGGHPFGTTFRVRPSVSLAGSVQVAIAGGKVQDEANNLNPPESFAWEASDTPARVHSGAARGSTAAMPLARSALENPFLFHGQFFDYDSGLLYCRARFYDPGTGLFLQPDPAGFQDTISRFAAFANNPINFRDPTGTAIFESHAEQGKALEEAGDEATIAKDGLSGKLYGMALSYAGQVMQLGTSAAEGLELLSSDAPGTLGLIDHLKGASLVASDVLLAADSYATLTGIPKLIFGSATRISGFVQRPPTLFETKQFLYRQGMTGIEINATIDAMREMGVTHFSFRSFKSKAAMRRSLRQGGMASKPLTEKHKTMGLQEKHPATVLNDRTGRRYTGDIDILHIEVAGRNATRDEVMSFIRSANHNYINRWSHVPRHEFDMGLNKRVRMRASPPFQHDTHLRLGDLYGAVVPGESKAGVLCKKVIDNSYIKGVGHPGEGISIRASGDGNILAGYTPRWYTDLKIREYESILKNRQIEYGEQPVGWVSDPARGKDADWHAWSFYGSVKNFMNFFTSPINQ